MEDGGREKAETWETTLKDAPSNSNSSTCSERVSDLALLWFILFQWFLVSLFFLLLCDDTGNWMNHLC